jgi:hypothetical protein
MFVHSIGQAGMTHLAVLVHGQLSCEQSSGFNGIGDLCLKFSYEVEERGGRRSLANPKAHLKKKWSFRPAKLGRLRMSGSVDPEFLGSHFAACPEVNQKLETSLCLMPSKASKSLRLTLTAQFAT